MADTITVSGKECRQGSPVRAKPSVCEHRNCERFACTCQTINVGAQTFQEICLYVPNHHCASTEIARDVPACAKPSLCKHRKYKRCACICRIIPLYICVHACWTAHALPGGSLGRDMLLLLCQTAMCPPLPPGPASAGQYSQSSRGLAVLLALGCSARALTLCCLTPYESPDVPPAAGQCRGIPAEAARTCTSCVSVGRACHRCSCTRECQRHWRCRWHYERCGP